MQERSTSVGQRDLTMNVPPETERVVVGACPKAERSRRWTSTSAGGPAAHDLHSGVAEVEGEAPRSRRPRGR